MVLERCEVQGRATSRFRSQTIERSLAPPQWNYQHRVRGYQEGDALKFTVYDEDYMSEDDFLGSAVPWMEWLQLDTGDATDQSFIKVAVSDREGNFSEPLDLGAKVALEANWFKILVGAVICINTVWLLVQSVFPYWRDRLWYLDPVFLAIYCLETGLRMGHWRLQFFSHPHEAGWNWFDLIIVLAGVLEEIETFSDDEKDGSGTGTQLMALRVFKPLRLVARLARFMRVVRLLRVLLTADFSWVESATFQSAVGVVILLNALIMGLETDIQSPIFEWAEQIMLSFFVLEAVLRVRHRGWEFFTSSEDGGWNILDMTIVASGVIDDWVLKAM
ncbi:Voltage-dependent R-type calcium channel subunit alpha-1E [Symbiodinium microadriaticum]|uniref:Voltage-dependent R-type calcium channel subunit alpha-1E n=1 Tax=Symbiodinium microadriaticum TaxID=2951 RepID=A0A1Q9DI73_SYMMI|nr:Voltage-dependent R-type calcium channel subunit alpha-1E [Symbiodinium microadriaticum]